MFLQLVSTGVPVITSIGVAAEHAVGAGFADDLLAPHLDG